MKLKGSRSAPAITEKCWTDARLTRGTNSVQKKKLWPLKAVTRDQTPGQRAKYFAMKFSTARHPVFKKNYTPRHHIHTCFVMSGCWDKRAWRGPPALIALEHQKIYLGDTCRAVPIKQARRPRRAILPVSRKIHNRLNGKLHYSLGAQPLVGRWVDVEIIMAWDYVEYLG